jgi:hypothetical protein
MYNMYNLSNEEKFALADFAASKVEKELGRKMTPKEYEAFVWDFIVDFYTPKYDQD